MSTISDRQLLRQYEPVLRFTRGEEFFPTRAQHYLERCSLWVQQPGAEPELLLPEGAVTQENLGEDRPTGFGAVQYLKFIDPLNLAELAAFRLKEGLTKRPQEDIFHPGLGRLARVGYTARFVDALFSLSLLARGRVPGDTAAAAALSSRQLQEQHPQPAYHGRVLRQSGWLILQYWLFYPFNNWRSGYSGANDHEADWEMVCVYLAEQPGAEPVPEWVGYASHEFSGDDLRRRWDDPELEKVSDSHPVVYVGAGSHAAYFEAGEYMTEIEVTALNPLARLVDFLQALGHNLARLARGRAPVVRQSRSGVNLFRIPFIDYARGDGHSIGAGAEWAWDEPELLTPTPEWVKGYRGLWGLYVRDQFAGENAPAGPMYNRDGRVRRAWYDPLGWAGLDKVVPEAQTADALAGRIEELENEADQLRTQIATISARLHTLGIEYQAMQGHAHMRHTFLEHARQIQVDSGELDQLREALTENRALTESLGRHARRVAAGERSPAQAHLQRAHHPLGPTDLRGGRLTEIWSAISIGLMMMIFVGLVLFASQYLFVGLAGMVVLLTLIEAGARRRLHVLVQRLTVFLAALGTLVLVYEFFWPLVEITIFLAGAYIVWENIRELVRR